MEERQPPCQHPRPSTPSATSAATSLLLAALFLGSCGDDHPTERIAGSLWISGQARMSPGAPVPDEDVRYVMHARTQATERNCEFTIGPRELTFDPDGGYGIVVHARDLTSTDPNCSLKKFSTTKLKAIRLDVRMAANSTLCADFCGTPHGEECAANCENAAIRLGAVHEFEKNDIVNAEVNESDALALKGTLIFDHIVEETSAP